MIIKKLGKSDAKDASRLIIKNLKTVNTKDYPREAIDVLVSYNTPGRIIERSKDCTTLVALSGKKVIGTAALGGSSPNQIRNVFVDKSFHKKGVGRELVQKLEGMAKKRHIKKIFLFSSLSAEEFYRRMGYKKIKKVIRDVDGIPLTVVRMEKVLNNQQKLQHCPGSHFL